jgi:DNA-binding GntR family transcriptional regulator
MSQKEREAGDARTTRRVLLALEDRKALLLVGDDSDISRAFLATSTSVGDTVCHAGEDNPAPFPVQQDERQEQCRMASFIGVDDTNKLAERPKSLAERAYDILRRDIINCTLKPGTQMNEQSLSAKLEMSKTPVREALGRLILDGLVEGFPRRGYRVTPVRVKDVTDLFTIRKALEGSAAELAALRMSDAELDELEKTAGARYTLGQEATIDSFVEANNRFHGAIAKGAQVPRLHAMIMSYLEESTRLFHMGATVRDVNPETVEDHERILIALRAHDGAAARDAMVQHSENTRKGLLSALITNEASALEL